MVGTIPSILPRIKNTKQRTILRIKAITCDLVIEEVKIPIAENPPASNKSPIYEPITSPQSIGPMKATDIGYISVHPIPMPSNARAARYFPVIIFQSSNGIVERISEVPSFSSSAMSRIVTAGIINKKKRGARSKNPAILA